MLSGKRTNRHTWVTSRFTNVCSCSKCGIVPVDPDDANTTCPGR